MKTKTICWQYSEVSQDPGTKCMTKHDKHLPRCHIRSHYSMPQWQGNGHENLNGQHKQHEGKQVQILGQTKSCD